MCAIAGSCSLTGAVSLDELQRLIERMRHRGPDDAGVWQSPSQRCALGHARLSIIDLSPAGHQPMVDPLTGNCIAFNGEIYNFEEERSRCLAAGDRFSSQSDTEVILALYRRYGIDCLQRLRGMYALAIWDDHRQQLLLARDPLGKKPLNYAIHRDQISFSSELDPLAQSEQLSRDLDEEALALYLHLQYIPAPWTIYRSIRKLPPAHYLIWNGQGFRVQRHWFADYQAKARISEGEAIECLDHKLQEAVKLRMIADVPLGALLSGGVDSSLVVGLMAAHSGRPVKTFSIGFADQSFNELPYAQAVAERYGTEHHVEIVDAQQDDLLPAIVKHYGEPFADASAIPTFHVCRAARRHVTVVLNGDGGDELLGGYPRYSIPALATSWSGFIRRLTPRKSLVRVGARLGSADTLARRAARKLLLDFVCPELRSMSVNSAFWSDQGVTRLLAGGRESPAAVLESWRSNWLQQAGAAAADPIDRLLWIDNQTYLPGALLPKMDIASMHCSLEARSPLLDREVVEFCAGLPAGMKVRGSMGKYLLKRVAERYVPRELLYRPKMGFDFPLSGWLRGALRPMVENVLRDPELMDPLDARVVWNTAQEFYVRGVDHSARIWVLLMFGMWKKICGCR